MVPYSTLLDSEAKVGILLISAGLGGDSWNMVNIGYCDPHIVFHLEYERRPKLPLPLVVLATHFRNVPVPVCVLIRSTLGLVLLVVGRHPYLIDERRSVPP